jgi:hypothetical protein
MKSGRPVAAHRTRSCRGGSLDQGEPVGGGWAEGGLLRTVVDSDEVSDGEVVDGARRGGCRSRTSGRRAAGGHGQACGTLGWAGGGWSAPVDDELTGEEAAAEETRSSGAAAGRLSSNWALDDEDNTATLQASSNDGSGGRLVVLFGEQRRRAESRGESEQSGSVGMEEAKRKSSTRPHACFIDERGDGRRRAR